MFEMNNPLQILWKSGLVLILAACLFGLGCEIGDGDRRSIEDGNDADIDADGDADSDADSDADGDNRDDLCSEKSKFVYVVDTNKSFYRFDPPAKKFTLVGKLNCGTGMDEPFSMAVSRDDVAYVLYAKNSLTCSGVYSVNTEDGSCIEKTPFKCGTNGFSLFGMGYATDGADTTEETLYIGKSAAPGKLAVLDTLNWSVTPAGAITRAPEFTGNAKGELWGFFPSQTPPTISHLDKKTGKIIENWPLQSLSSDANAWAFAYWGGSFYVFYKTFSDSSTNVYKVTDGVLETYMTNTGKYIVGAGVSTCAPTAPPV